jgi:hypothetical protein
MNHVLCVIFELDIVLGIKIQEMALRIGDQNKEELPLSPQYF